VTPDAVRVPASSTAVQKSPALTEAAAAPSALLPDPGAPADPPAAAGAGVEQTAKGDRPQPKAAAGGQGPAPVMTGLLPGAARTEATLPADAPASPSATPPAVPEQIVSAVVPLHGRGDGRHEVTLELRPDDLGTIRVEVSVEHQTVHLTLHAAEPSTGHLLAAVLPELRSALADAGLQAGHLAVNADGGAGTGRRHASPEPGETAERRPGRSGTAGGNDSTDTVRPVRPATAGRLDLFL
jgi:flagellar hook-length control protein FliK